MNIEDQLKNIKTEYQSTKVPSYLVYDGWTNLKLQLPAQSNSFISAYFKKALVFAVLLLVVLAGTAKVSQAAKPGDKLYPIKLATENIVSIVTGNQTNKIENRANEIIDLTKNNDKNLGTAVQRYEDTVDSSKNNTSDNNKQELKDTLQNQEEKLQNARSTNSQDQKLIERALEKTREIQGEIKGAKDSNQNSQDQKSQNSNDHGNRGDNQGSNRSTEGD